ncbi:MAG: hypothetical protein JW934_08190, partial [Anaerolineae bacterium]|nr:hypothetical protein [Anaerolineae bacterium]
TRYALLFDALTGDAPQETNLEHSRRFGQWRIETTKYLRQACWVSIRPQNRGEAYSTSAG